jgi:hypothetical protein
VTELETLRKELQLMHSQWLADGGESGQMTIPGEMILRIIEALCPTPKVMPQWPTHDPRIGDSGAGSGGV